MNRIARLAALTAAAIAAAPAAQAAQYAFTLSITGSSAAGANFNVPRFTLTNTSDNGALIEAFSLTIGDLAYNFDYFSGALTAPTGGTIAITTGDASNGGDRYDLVALAFTDFAGGEFARWFLDVDEDSANTTEDFRTVFFNNGGAGTPNATATVTYEDGLSISTTFTPTNFQQTTYNFGAFQFDEGETEVPVPAALPLAAAGFAALGFAARRRKG